ncbi:PREDICTED: DNA polymerase epsilon subunit 4, partial [Pterocles gutturalis]|uniref:DNA polymerase epsilon subunit 4 n=1 Tax=Pterocles gutturalis TaxID=240206 RepID=UPI000528B023
MRDHPRLDSGPSLQELPGLLLGTCFPQLSIRWELFVETIAKDAYVYALQGKRKTLQRKDLDNAIEAIDEFAFLEGEREGLVRVCGVRLCVGFVHIRGFCMDTVAISREDEQGNLFAGRGCCRRQSHFLHVGTGLGLPSITHVRVDVGKCRSSCLEQISSPHPSLLGVSRHSSVLDFLRSKGYLRLPALKTFFPDSPWEVTMDMGRCSDPTPGADGLFCMPTKFSTALVKTPQGEEVVRMLEKCEMKEKCHRVSQVGYYSEIVHSSAGCREERLKEIDVGRCLGSCSPRGIPARLGKHSCRSIRTQPGA